MSLLDSLQGAIDVVEQMNQMNDDQRENLNSVLGDNEGVIMLESLSKKGKEILKRTGISLEGRAISILKNILIYIMPLLIVATLGYATYKGTCCLLKRSKMKAQPPVHRIIIQERSKTRMGDQSNENEAML